MVAVVAVVAVVAGAGGAGGDWSCTNKARPKMTCCIQRECSDFPCADKTLHNERVRILFLIVIFVAVPGTARAAAWIEAARHGELAVGSSTFSGAVAYDDDAVGGPAPGPLRVQTIAADLRLGLGHGFMGLVRLPFVIAIARDDDGQHTAVGAGDAVVGLQLGVFEDGPVAVAVRADAKLPLYVGAPSVIGRQPVDGTRVASALPAIGDGQLDVTATGMLGARLPFGGHLTFDLGYRWRLGDVSDAVVGVGSFAVPILDERLTPTWDLLFINSLDAAVNDDGVPTEAVGRGFVSTGPSVDVSLREITPGLRVRVGAEFVFRGRNAPGGINLLWGVACAF